MNYKKEFLYPAVLSILLGACIPLVFAADHPNELTYNAHWCALNHGHSTNLPKLSTGKIPDCVTVTHAIETDWAPKAWKEGVGQALHYADELNLQPGILVIMREQKDCKELAITERTARKNIPRITVWQTGPYAQQC